MQKGAQDLATPPLGVSYLFHMAGLEVGLAPL